MFSRTSKTLYKGLPKSRSGSSPIGLQTLIDRAQSRGFVDRVKKAVSDTEALEAARVLTMRQKGRARRYAEGAAIGAAASPVVRLVGRATEAAVGAPRGSLRTSLRRVRVSRPELARQMVEGALAGGGVQALREGAEIGKAKKTVQKFMGERLPRLHHKVDDHAVS